MGTFYNPKIVTNGLVMHLDANNLNSYPRSGTLWRDITGNGNNGTITNDPIYNSGTFSFDGINDYVSVDYSISNNMAGMSMTAGMFCKSNTASWNIYWAGISRYSQFILGANGVGGQMAFIPFLESGGWQPSNYGSAIWGQSGLDITKWHHYMGVFDKVLSKVYLYVDAVLQAELATSVSNIANDTGPIHIAHREFDVVGTSHFSASIANVQIYNRALTAIEVTQNFNALRGRFGI